MPKSNIYSDTERLIHDLQTDNEDAYRYLFSTYHSRLQRYAMHFISDTDTVDDIIQDSFLRFWEKRHAITFTSVQALLFRIMRNNCLNYLRNKAVQQKHTVSNTDEEEAWERLYYTDFFDSPDHDLLYKELRMQIESALDELSERSQEIFRISRFEGLKNHEIAERLGISVKIVERHIGRALKLLNNRFKDIRPYLLQILLLAWLNQ